MNPDNPAPAGRVLLVGCGRMGRALASGWLSRGLAPADLLAVEPESAAAAAARHAGLAVVASADEIHADYAPDWVVLAVKPQVLADAAAPFARYRTLAHVLSIAAGKTIASLAGVLGSGARIVRAMPNTPAAIGRGITVAVAGPGVEEPARAACGALLGAVGEVVWVEDEAMMDAVTAVSGSGPAYVFLLIECLAEAGREAGLPAALAAELARATVAGAGELARRSGEDAAALRRNVTSPGGTTAAALEVLQDGERGMQSLLTRAVAAAAARSRALSG